MATSQQQLSFAIRAVNDASATLKQVQGQLNDVGTTAAKSTGHLGGLGSSLRSVAKIAGGFVAAQGLLKLPGFLFGAAEAAAEDEAATLRMNRALENLVAAYNETPAALAGLKRATEGSIAVGQTLAFTDDQVRD